jgi:uracil-DNA glycosylase family 4
MFGGRPAADIAGDMPIIGTDTPALPTPGRHLIRQAIGLGDSGFDPDRPVRAVDALRAPWFTALTRSVLYQPDTSVTVDDDPYLFQPGVSQCGDTSLFGPSPCQLMVVGKCLGRQELESRVPFCGHGSKDLWRAWTEAKLPRPGSDLPTYMTNLLKFVPPFQVATKPVSKDLMADGRYLLYHEMAMCRPAVLLLLGADAVKAVLGRGATVSAYKGRVGRVSVDFRPDAEAPPDVWTADVIVADHPAAVGRDPDMYPTFLSSIEFLSRRLGFMHRRADVKLDHRTVTTVAELRSAVRESELASANGGYVAFDCEWHGKHPSDDGSYLYTVQWSHAPGHGRVLFLRRCGGAPNPSLPLDGVVPLLDRLLRRAPERGSRLVGHYAKGDVMWLHSIGVDLYETYVGAFDDDEAAAEVSCYTKGAHDTYVSAHAVQENREKKLEIMAAVDFGLERYDTPVVEWLDAHCKSAGIRKSAILGYGDVPEHIIGPYAAMDADVAGREYLLHNGDPKSNTRGMLDSDQFGLNSRRVFSARMRAWAAMAEMERYGLEIDCARHTEMTAVLVGLRDKLLGQLREKICWPDFSPSKKRHLCELLFADDALDPCRDHVAPEGALRCDLVPFKATDRTGGDLWDRATEKFQMGETTRPDPSTDKESLTVLARSSPIAAALLDIASVSTMLKSTFRPVDEPEEDSDEDPEHTAGLMAYRRGNGRVSTMMSFVETGRQSSSKVNLQNVSASADDKLNKLLGWAKYAIKGSPESKRQFVTRSVFKARAGQDDEADWYLVDADLKGAEIAMAAWQSGDPLLIEHARRNTLDESDPEWLDLHSDLAKNAFDLQCSLKEVKEKYGPLRVAAKRARFGHYYGSSPESILRQCQMESPDVTLDNVIKIVTAHDRMYPVLAAYFAEARVRVGRGWLRNSKGGTRRFRKVGDRSLRAVQERSAQNWTCQGGVADHINDALGLLWSAKRSLGLRSRIVLAVHDSIVMECPPDEVTYVHDELLPWAMGSGLPFVPSDLSGNLVNRGPYYFGVSCKVGRHWGIDLDRSVWSPKT